MENIASSTTDLSRTTSLEKDPSAKQSPGRVVLPDPTAPIQEALAALALETGVPDWELLSVQRRAEVWEWEAVNSRLERQARVQVKSWDKAAQIYLYPSVVAQHEDNSVADPVSETDDNSTINKQRLKVTPLGAAQGIGASCFRVEIGPYEVVLDCGTRPKGCDPLPALSYLHHPDLMIVSHAHQDHIGGVPVFHSRWPDVRMISTLR